MSTNSDIVNHLVTAMKSIQIEERETGSLPPSRHVTFPASAEDEKPTSSSAGEEKTPEKSELPKKKMGRFAGWWAHRQEKKKGKAARKREMEMPPTVEEREKIAALIKDCERLDWLQIHRSFGAYKLANKDKKLAELFPRTYSRPLVKSVRGSHLLHILCYSSKWEENVCKKNEVHFDRHFKNKGYVIQTAKDPSEVAILDMIAELDVAGPNVLIWFSCHGTDDSHRQGIACGDNTFLPSEYLIWIVTEAKNLRGKKKILVFDTCRNSGMTPDMASIDLSESCVIFAVEDGTSAYVTQNGSLFPNVFLSALDKLDEGLLQTMSDVLFRYWSSPISLSIELDCRTTIVRRPEFYTAIKDDFFL